MPAKQPSGLPQQILPQGVPFCVQDASGNYIITQNWWLFLYNVAKQALAPTGQVPATSQLFIPEVDIDAGDADAAVLPRQIANALLELPTLLEQDASPTYRDQANTNLQLQDMPDASPTFRDLSNAYLLALDPLLQDPQPAAQPAQAISPSGSPFTYTAPAAGTVYVTGGTVSAIAIVRQATSVATGLTVGGFPVSRADAVKVTYTGAPTMTFLPT